MFTDKGDNLMKRSVGRGMELWSGHVGGYTAEDMARIVEATTRSYVEWGLFGDFPMDNEIEWRKLVSEMAEGFDELRLVVSLWKREKWLGGVMGVLGKSDKPVKKLIGKRGAFLPTLAALRFEGEDKLLNLPERQMACFVRFGRLPDKYWSDEEREFLPSFTKVVLGELVRLIDWHNRQGGEVRGVILDTHDSKLVTMLIRRYAGRLISRMAEPTPQVLPPNILSWHYQRLRPAVVGFDFDIMLAGGNKGAR